MILTEFLYKSPFQVIKNKQACTWIWDKSFIVHCIVSKYKAFLWMETPNCKTKKPIQSNFIWPNTKIQFEFESVFDKICFILNKFALIFISIHEREKKLYCENAITKRLSQLNQGIESLFDEKRVGNKEKTERRATISRRFDI